jgi:hypothetical protein
MLVLKYFLFVGTALTIGLFALGSHMETEQASRPRTHTTATLAVAPAPQKPKAAVQTGLYNEQLPPPPETRGRGNRRN